MPKFFFYVHDDIDAEDEEGRNLPDIDAAKAAAIEGARDIACHQVSKGYLNLSHRIDVEDADRKPLFTVTFEEAIRVTS